MVRFLASLMIGLATMPAATKATEKLLVFPFEMIDAAQDAGAMGLGAGGGLPTGPRPDEVRRLRLITDDLRRRIAADGRYGIIEEHTSAAEIAEKGPIHKCNGCEDDIAKKAGAELVLVATVEKLSDLLFNFNLYLRDVALQKMRAVMSTTVQGSTDEAWLRGIRYLAERKLLVPGDVK